MDVEIFESAKKNLRIQKYQDMCGWGLRIQPALCCFTHEPTTSHVEAFELARRRPTAVVTSVNGC